MADASIVPAYPDARVDLRQAGGATWHMNRRVKMSARSSFGASFLDAEYGGHR
jgi:hypothetical protein